MAEWKKVIVSGSNAELNQVTASFFAGDGSALTNVPAGSVNIESFDDGTGITVDAANDKLLLSDGGTEKYVTVDQVVSTAIVTSAGALMDSEVDADIKTLSLPANTTISTFGKSLVDDSNASTARTTLGLSGLATLDSITVDEIAAETLITSVESFEDSDDTKIATVRAINGAGFLTSINNGDWSGTDLAVTNGGTGASNASDARDNLGLTIGTDVQAYDAGLADIAGLAVTDGNFIVGDGSNFVAESGATARTSLGLGSLATLSSISNSNWSGTDLAITNGGTGASNASDARDNLGLTIGTDVQAYDAGLNAIAGLAVTDGNFIVGNGTTFVAESGATARTSLGLGSLATASDITVDEINATTLITSVESFEDSDDTKIATVRAINGAGFLTSINNGDWSGTDLAIANGGTGASSAAAAANNLLNVSQGGALTIGDSSDTITIAGNLTVSGTTTTVNTTNLDVTDTFISLNDGGSATDSGIVVEGQGTAFAWDESENRWGYDFTGADGSNNTVTFDAYAATVVTSDDANYRKTGNIRVQSGEIFIYV